MDIFDSKWLLRMLAKSSNIPQQRILGLFDILNDCLNAPNIKLHLAKDITSDSNPELIAFITEQAEACGADNPEIFAEQLMLIACKATLYEISYPGHCSLIHAKVAANALLEAHRQQDQRLSHKGYKIAFYGLSTGVLLLLSTIVIVQYGQDLPDSIPSKTLQTRHIVDKRFPYEKSLSPLEIASMYEQHERMRNGICQYPEALSIPDKDRSIYLEIVVGGQSPKNYHDMKIAQTYFEKVNCYYSPLLSRSFHG